MKSEKIRQPIVTVCGHIDHGKTSILDCIRGSSVQEKEKGGITQKISFTLYPLSRMKEVCPLIDEEKINLSIPGFLFIDTPGHAAFSNIRKRGGSLADIAILVMDINEGIKSQTAEVIQILKMNKVPFIVALNKIDNISGWRTFEDSKEFKERIESQSALVRSVFDERYMRIIGSLNSHGFDADLFYNIADFTKKVALVPCSARTGEGISELLMMLCGLSQKYLVDKLSLGKDARGVILEIKKEKTENYIECILYDGELSKQDTIAVASMDGELIISRIRVLEEILPLKNKFKPKDKVQASTGLRMQLVTKEKILAGMPFVKFKDNKEEIEKSFKKEISESIKTQRQGIIAKADSLGSLEALISLLNQNNISVVKAEIGSISKTDIASAKANIKINEMDAVIVGFNVKEDEDAKELTEHHDAGVKILTEEVIYKLIDELLAFREAKRREIEKRRLLDLTSLFKLRILHKYVFRNTSPAIFGVKVEAGKLIPKSFLIDDDGNEIGRIKSVQSENKSVNEATEGMEVAISVPGVNFERRLNEKQFLYSDITEGQSKNLEKNKDLLLQSEISALKEIEGIKKFK